MKNYIQSILEPQYSEKSGSANIEYIYCNNLDNLNTSQIKKKFFCNNNLKLYHKLFKLHLKIIFLQYLLIKVMERGSHMFNRSRFDQKICYQQFPLIKLTLKMDLLIILNKNQENSKFKGLLRRKYQEDRNNSHIKAINTQNGKNNKEIVYTPNISLNQN